MSYPKRFINQSFDTTLLSAILLVLLCVLLINSFYIFNRINNKTAAVPATVLTSQQTAITPDVGVRVTHVSLNLAPDPAFTLADDQIMLDLGISVTNRSKSVQSLFPVNQFFVRTRSGDYAPLHPSIYIKHPLAATTVRPNQTVSGDITFGVPKSATDLYLYVDTGWNDEAPIVFDVLR